MHFECAGALPLLEGFYAYGLRLKLALPFAARKHFVPWSTFPGYLALKDTQPPARVSRLYPFVSPSGIQPKPTYNRPSRTAGIANWRRGANIPVSALPHMGTRAREGIYASSTVFKNVRFGGEAGEWKPPLDEKLGTSFFLPFAESASNRCLRSPNVKGQSELGSVLKNVLLGI